MNRAEIIISIVVLSVLVFLIASCESQDNLSSRSETLSEALYTANRAPLRANPYIELPIGAVRANGWLEEMLVRQRDGSTGRLDEIWPEVVGPSNNWVGGDGDRWERGPYWLHGLTTLAYVLDDSTLKEKARPWIEWSLASQREDGFFGPIEDGEPDKQHAISDFRYQARDGSLDWWPRIVMLKVMKNYYLATEDPRVIDFLTRYFRYQIQTLPTQPLDTWRHWAKWRGGDNLMVVYWLYNHTGDEFLLDLADLIHRQTVDYTHIFLETDAFETADNFHTVNIAQGIKEPAVYYQRNQDSRLLEGIRKAFRDIRMHMGLPHGLYGGDEGLRDSDPTHGSEFCTTVEMMYSLEQLLQITGDVTFADHLEEIAFNALPTQATDDFMYRQYYQQANQIKVTRHRRNFSLNHRGSDIVFGHFSGYTCCLANMHQGWPEFTRHLWFATPDRGIAALVYAPSTVTALVADGYEIRIIEETNYPFEEQIRFRMELDGLKEIENTKNVSSSSEKPSEIIEFPFHFRIPSWSESTDIRVNGNRIEEAIEPGTIFVINRPWRHADEVTVDFSPKIRFERGHERSITVRRGALTYALKMGEEWRWTQNDTDPERFGEAYWEVHPTTPWNYGLINVNPETQEHSMEFVRKNSYTSYQDSHDSEPPSYPWNLSNVPIEIRAKGRRMVNWLEYNESAGPLPYSNRGGQETLEPEEITLVPYGATTLRISAFPVIGKYGNKQHYRTVGEGEVLIQ